MIHVHPFRAWRPAPHTAHLVGSRSFLSYSPGELKEKLAGNPYSFLHIIHAGHEGQGLSRAEHYDQVKLKFREFVQAGILQRDAAPALYVYEQSSAAFTSRGLISAVDVKDYGEGRVKVHEQTLTNREAMFEEYLDHTGINAEPVLLAVPEASGLEAALDAISMRPPLYDFCTTDQVRHRFWKVDAHEDISFFTRYFGAKNAVYIADGHHRCASSARLAASRGAGPGSPEAAFLAFLVPGKRLHIHNFDRAVKGLNGMRAEDFLQALGQVGALETLPGPAVPALGTVQVFADGHWYALHLPGPAVPSPANGLDAHLLDEHVLRPVLGINDLRTDPRVRFVPGNAGTAELERLVRSGEADVAFHLRAITFADLCAVADNKECMPPKTTWIEPKLRSGLTIYSLDDH